MPVVTFRCEAHVARVGSGILTHAGLSDYVAIAVRAAADIRRLGQIRAGLRKTMAEFGLTDSHTVTREIEAAYRTMWREWCGARNGKGAE